MVFWGFEISIIVVLGILGFLHWIFGIWETANLWSFDMVFWGFEISISGSGYFGVFTLNFWDLGNCKSLVFWHGILGIWDIDHSGSGYFGVFTLNFWDLGNCKSLVFWHVQDNFIKQLFCVSRAIKRVLHWFYRFCFIFTVNLIGRSK